MCALKELCTIRTPSGIYYPQASEIVSRVHISDLWTATHLPSLKALRITHIVSVIPGDVDLPPWEPSRLLQIAVDDMPFTDIFCYLDRAVRWIIRALSEGPDTRVLVHCFQGISRSATVVCAYLMASRVWTVSQALAHIKAVRSIAQPNFGFISQLREYEEALKKRRPKSNHLP